MVNLHMVRLPKGSSSGHQSSNGLMRVPPSPSALPNKVTLQMSPDRSIAPPLPGEGRTCFPRYSDEQGMSRPFHHPLATIGKPTW